MSRAMKSTNTAMGRLLYRRRYPTRLRAHSQIQGELYASSLGVDDKAAGEEQPGAGQATDQTCEGYLKVLICS